MEIAALGLRVDGVRDIDQASASLDRFTKSGSEAEKSTGRFGSESKKATQSTKGLGDSAKNASSGMGSLATTAMRAAASIGLIVSASATMRGAVSVISNFESSMSRVQAISRATHDEMRQLSATARELGATTQFSAAQAADALQFLAMAGFDTAQAIAAIPGVLDLAAASGLGLAQAADTATNIMSGFNLAAAEAGRVADILAAASSRANTDVAQLGDAMSTAAPVATAMGISIEDTTAAIGALSDAGLQGARAGTALRGVFASLAKPTEQAEQALGRMGLSADLINPELSDLATVLGRLGDAGLGTADAMTIFGREAASGALVLAASAARVGEFGDELREAEGEARRMAETMQDNLQGDMRQLRSVVEELALAVGDEAGLSAKMRLAVQSSRDFFATISEGISSGAFKALTDDINETTRAIDFLSWNVDISKRFWSSTFQTIGGLIDEGRLALGWYGQSLDHIEEKIARVQKRLEGANTASLRNQSNRKLLAELEELRDFERAMQGDTEARVALFVSLNEELENLATRMGELSERQSFAARRESNRLAERQAEVLEMVNRLNSGMMTQEQIIESLGGAVDDWVSPIERAHKELTIMSASIERFRVVTAESNSAVEDIISELEAEQRQLTMTSEELLEYAINTALGEDANKVGAAAIRNKILALHEQNEAIKESRRLAEEATKAIDKYSKSGAKIKELVRDFDILSAAKKRGVEGASEAIDELLDSLITVEHRTTELAVTTEESTDWMATAFERGVERMRDGIGDFFERMIVDGKASFSDLTDLFKKMIAEMIATAAANRIMIGLGFMGAAGGASAGGLGGGGGGNGLSDILSMKNLVNVLDSGFASVGNVILQAGGLISRAGGHFAIAASNMGMGLVAAGDAIGGAIGMTNMSAGAAAGLGGVATAGAGWAGGRIGSDLGLALTGKEGSGWGATGGAAIGAYVGSIVPVLGTMLGAAIGGLIGGVVDSIFGSSAWNTTRGGLQLGFGEDGFDPMQWERQTKRGGLFGSTKRRYRFNELDDELDAALSETYDATLDSVRELYGILGVAVEDGVLEGVQIATLQIGTSGKSKQSQEAIEQQIGQWFADLQEAAVQAVDSSMTVESLTIYASSLASVNEVFGAIGLSSYDVSIEGGKAAAQLLQLAGGIENLLTATDFYYQNFYSAHERMGLLTEQTAAAFEAMGLALPESRQAFRDIVEGIDQTTEEGQALFLQLLNIAPAFADLTGRMGDLDREADELRIELLKLSGDMEGAAAASKALATDGMSALEIAAWERNQSLLQQIEEQKRAQEELTRAEQDQIRAALEAADAAQKLAAEQERAAQQMARAQAQALSSIERSIGGLRERIILDQLGTPEAQYGYYKSQIDAMGGMIGGLSSPEAIASLVGQMTSLAGSAYGLLDESGQRERGSEYLSFLDNLQHQSTQAIEKAEQKKAEQQAKILEEAMMRAGAAMAEAVQAAIEEGSLDLQNAGQVMASATRAFAGKVNELNRSREVNA